jgi:formylglycine-generating enzyme
MLFLIQLTAAQTNIYPNTAYFEAGSFVRGSGRSTDESPRHEVYLSEFYIDKYEVSIADFEHFVQKAYNNDDHWSKEGQTWKKQNPTGSGSEHRRAGRKDNHPVVAVSWYEADAYCKYKGGSLPTESQWERASCPESNRETSQPAQKFPWGNDDNMEVVWYSGGKYGHLQTVLTKPVQQAPTNQVTTNGLVHTVGNVWEWTNEYYHRESYKQKETPDPKGPDSGMWKTLRGGSYMNLPSYCSCTHREPAPPDRISYTIGFRCAYAVPPSKDQESK